MAQTLSLAVTCWAALFLIGTVTLLGIATAFRVRLQSKERLAILLADPKMRETGHARRYRARSSEVSARAFCLPILVLFCANAGFAILLFDIGGFIEALLKEARPILLCGQHCEGADAATVTQGALVGVDFAFLGWLVWTQTIIFERFRSSTIFPTTFYRLTGRLMVSVIVALVLTLSGSALLAQHMPVEVVGFVCGMVPEAVVAKVLSSAQSLYQAQRKSEELPLDLIEGLSVGMKFKLSEMDIDNAENLAKANPIALWHTTGLVLLEAVDWIDQAQLLQLVKTDNFQSLQRVGIRKLSDYVVAIADPAGLQSVAGLLNLACGLVVIQGQILARTTPEYAELREIEIIFAENAGRKPA